MENNPKNFSKEEKLIAIERMLDAGETVTGKGLAEYFGIAERTVYFLISILKDYGHPIRYSRVRGSYYLEENP